MLSIYLPHVFPNVDETFIRQVVEDYHHLGKVSRVDIVMISTRRNSVYVHFEFWNNQFTHVRRFQDRLSKDETISLTCGGKFFWHVRANRSQGKKLISSDRRERIDVETRPNLAIEQKLGMKSNQYFAQLVNSNVA